MVGIGTSWSRAVTSETISYGTGHVAPTRVQRDQACRRASEVRVAVAGADGGDWYVLVPSGDVGNDLGPQPPRVPPPTATSRCGSPPARLIVSRLWRTPKAVASSSAR